MAKLMTVVRRLAGHEHGQDLIEYGLLAALIAIAAMVSVTALGDTIYNIFWKQIAQAL